MKELKIIIAGSRNYSDYEFIKETMDRLYDSFLVKHEASIEIISGGAYGADYLGERYAHEKGYKLTVMPALWNEHGKAAGPIRNEQMAIYADHLVAFPLGTSKGTEDMIKVAKKHKLNTHVFV